MRCHFCDGTGMRPQGGVRLPCPECGGCGVAHCCDGIQACCEIDGDMRLEPAAPQQIGAGPARKPSPSPPLRK